MAKKKSKLPAAAGSASRLDIPVSATGNVWQPFSRMREEFDRMFDDIPGNAFGSRMMQKLYDSADPAVELRDKKDEYELVAEVPGMSSDDIEIKLSDGVLRLKGEKSESHEEEGESFMFSERHYGSFERAIKLPNGVDHKKISADARDGLLTVHIPKSAEAIQKERKIPINTA
ncbi:HSP20 family protein [Parasphingorhabdus marina DSM 22363]|uniref:HSP20 family protein n=1 Tax=Parasphingorhabdus marina DSM 22363 TaxID=1123272 RepID=A0A1N6CQN4_9SPHN|nr:Hsp20/alpha crystallin family protein [Parasphingorhabdus marina]SIN60759.1 HSP20 family protein [Parasphingorhabdus marina DSM 22363]